MVGFHLYFPIGYINSASYFCMATETVADLANKAISQWDQADEHPLILEDNIRASDDAGAHKDQADSS